MTLNDSNQFELVLTNMTKIKILIWFSVFVDICAVDFFKNDPVVLHYPDRN